jgi:hypothetical protein|tara:strand:- start:1118 stop:1324 length:207 start_codon:yes stop_codon:yes gene_type:complete
MLDIGTLQSVRHYIRKEIDKTKEDICYGIDKLEQLHYAKGKLAALEAVLQDLKDLQNREDSVDDIDQT